MAAAETETGKHRYFGFIFRGSKPGDDICYGDLVASHDQLEGRRVPDGAIGHYICEAEGVFGIYTPADQRVVVARCFYRGKVVSRWDRVRALNEACREKGTPVELGGRYLMIEGCNAEPLRHYDNVLV